MTNRVEAAVSCFEEGFSCSQAVLSSFSDLFHLDRIISLKIAQPFGGGMAHRGETCGAVTGAFMVIGLKYGRTKAEDLKARERTYEKVNTFVDLFTSLYSSIVCRDLLGIDISTQKGFEQAEGEKLFETVCPKFIRTSAEILEKIL